MSKPYSSSLINKEWEIIEPLLPKKKRTRPPIWTKRQIIDSLLYQSENANLKAIAGELKELKK